MTQAPYGGAPGGQQGPPWQQGPPPKRRNPWVVPVAVLGTLVLLGAVVLGGGATVWFLDPFGWRASPTAQEERPEESSDPSQITAGTTDYQFTYPVQWETIEPTETAGDSQVFKLEGKDAEERTSFSVAETESFGGDPIEVCWGLAEKNGYEMQDDIDLDGQTAKHFQNRSPTPSGDPQVRDAWCAKGVTGTMIVIIGRSSGPGADDLEQSAPHVIVDSWTWTD